MDHVITLIKMIISAVKIKSVWKAYKIIDCRFDLINQL